MKLEREMTISTAEEMCEIMCGGPEPEPETRPMTQVDRILRHLEDYGSITQAEAMNDYGIMRLASRISDMRKRGYQIISERVSSKNRYGETVSYARYSLKEDDNETRGNQDTEGLS